MWMRVRAIADTCLGIESYCGFSKIDFCCKNTIFSCSRGSWGPEWSGTPINRYPLSLQDRITRDPLILVPANARRCRQVQRHLLGGGRERRGLQCQKNKNPVMSEKKVKKDITKIFFRNELIFWLFEEMFLLPVSPNAYGSSLKNISVIPSSLSSCQQKLQQNT